MGTKVGFVYATVSKIVRRIIVPTHDAELADPRLLASGESMLVADQANGIGIEAANAAIRAKTGVTPPSSRCAVRDVLGKVKAVISADPALDSISDATLLLSSTAAVGDSITIDGAVTKPEPPPAIRDGRIIGTLG